MTEELKDYITVAEYAAYIQKTPQYVYHLIQNGSVASVEFNRGKMAGRLVLKPEGYDEWKAVQEK